MPDFDRLYANLNPQQRLAVDTVEGPVLVLAGPGTGKTQTLAVRVANILRRTQMRPGNILCLTFSTSGATAMRERLRRLIGADAYGVTVSTIHGFCQSIIDQYPQAFDEWSMQEPITDMQRYSALQRIIDRRSADSLLINPKDPYGRIPDFITRFSQIKREGKSIDDLQAALVALQELTDAKNARARTESGRQRNQAVVDKFREFIGYFQAYQAMLAETGRYDYDDMVLSALAALREHDWLLAGLQERYQYILVDEAQDTNGAQWSVIDRLTTYPDLAHEPNLFVVGDDDQAIYRFQGANVQNMLRFHQRFPAAPVIVLGTSYRSTPPIIQAAGNVIARNEERLVGRIPGVSKDLSSALAASDSPGLFAEPTLLRVASNAAEPWAIADLIQDRLALGIPAQEIAVLAQKNEELFPLYDVLRARGLPVLLHGKADLLEHPLVAEVLSVLRAVQHPDRDAVFLAALATRALVCHPADLSRLSLAAREQRRSVQAVLVDLERVDLPWLRAEALQAARDAILELVHHAESQTVLETVERVLRLVSGQDQHGPLDLAAIETFFHYVKGHCRETPGLKLAAFMRQIEFYADPDIPTRLTYQLPHLVTTGVQLMTAHQSKGLEFTCVILSNFRDGHWDKRRRPSGISIPEDLLFGWSTDQKQFEQGQDERRLAFVAMTRAKRELLFVCPHELAAGERYKAVSPSAFFAEAGQWPEVEFELRDPVQATHMVLRPMVDLDAELSAYVRERLEHFALSATSLARFLRDPQEFLRVDLLGQPEHFDEGTARRLGYGSAIHWALNAWGSAQQRGEDFDLNALVSAFQWHLQNRSILTEQQILDLSHLGEQTLARYYDTRLKGTHPHIYGLERDYRARFGDIPLKGKIDRIDQLSPTSGHVIIIDYKAGAAKTVREIRGDAEPGTVSVLPDGDRFRQLVFYSLLLEQADPLITPVHFALEYLGERGEDPERLEFEVRADEREALRAIITRVWTKITALDFTPLAPTS